MQLLIVFLLAVLAVSLGFTLNMMSSVDKTPLVSKAGKRVEAVPGSSMLAVSERLNQNLQLALMQATSTYNYSTRQPNNWD
jgi:cell division protein YceG involved in septum cleavage